MSLSPDKSTELTLAWLTLACRGHIKMKAVATVFTADDILHVQYYNNYEIL